MTSRDAGLPGEQRNDEQMAPLDLLRAAELFETLSMGSYSAKNDAARELSAGVKALIADAAAVRVELQAARHEAAAARADAAQADYVLAATGEKLEMVREQRDQAEAGLTAARRTLDEIRALIRDWADDKSDDVTLVTMPTRIAAIIDRASSSDTETRDEPRGANPCGDLEPSCRDWSDAEACEYNPACCRFPKSCSANRCDRPHGHAGDHTDHSMPEGHAGRSWNDSGDYTGAVPETRDKETRHG